MTTKLTLVAALAAALAGCIYHPRYDHDYPRRRSAYRVETAPPPKEPVRESSDRDDWSMNERGGDKSAPARETTEAPRPQPAERVYYVQDYYPVRTYYHYDPWPYWYGGWGWHHRWHHHHSCHPHWGFGIHWHLR